MTEVIGVSFNDSKKIYYFLPNGIDIKKGDNVIVETERGMQFAKATTDFIKVDPKKLKAPLKDVVRLATKKDKETNDENIKLAKKALEDANRFIKEENLDMKILTADFTFDKKQLLFNFLADDRIDFRNLAKKLAAIYKTRIELRQIGVRDKAREVGGYGQCGGRLCCATFLKDIDSVSINMAKNQNLALNPQKINGVCGRLMCCLSYENECYAEYKKGLPKVGDKISTKDVKGKVIYVDIFKKVYKIETEEGKIIEMSK